MIAFRVDFKPGLSLFEQVAYAAKKAIISGYLRPGDPFPSVRAISRELKINPNTAHKVVMHLIGAGLLEARPGIGTVVAPLPESTRAQRANLLGNQIEGLVVDAKKLSISLEEVLSSVSSQWKTLSDSRSVPGPNRGGRSKS
jgi:GntR family transcriptional regulator